MGGNFSKQQVLNKTLNEVALEVLTRNSTSLSGSTEQNNTLDIIGNTSQVKINGFEQASTSKINVSSLAQAVANNTLQADLINTLKSEVEKADPTLAVGSNSEQEIQNIIENNIKSKITIENLSNIAANVKQENQVRILANAGVDATNIVQRNEAEMILALVNEATSKIVAEVSAKNTTDSKASQKAAPLVDLGIGGAGIIILLIILVIIGGGGYYLSTMTFTDMVTKPIPLAVIATIAVSLIGGIFYAVSSSGSEEKKQE